MCLYINFLLVLIWVQTFLQNYRQTTKLATSKERDKFSEGKHKDGNIKLKEMIF